MSEAQPPLVSVVVPTYNRRSLLPLAIDSVFRQTYPHWEIIVVDDGSTDDTFAVIPAESRIRVIRRDHSGNVAALRNLGVAAAAGEFVGFLDSDDSWLPDKLERQIAGLLATPNLDWCFSSYRLINLNNEPIALRWGAPTMTAGGYLFPDILQGRAGIAIQTVVVRVEVARALEFDERVPFGEDFDFLVRLSRTHRAMYVAGTLADVRHHPGRSSHVRYDQTLHVASAFRRYRLLTEDPELRSHCLRESFTLTREYLARARARGGFFEALVRAGRMWMSRPGPARS